MNKIDLSIYVNKPLSELIMALNPGREGEIDVSQFMSVTITEGDVQACFPPSLRGLLGIVRGRITPNASEGELITTDEP